ncbi:3437_t:CDS:1 [Cetraspora pellucida]|uniref:3437_t:CDS:1 n=1 Tax=Cetraspora pellucida TaxID=1433469 RepID=A0A9N9CYU3_9GLOM|nr:3437_t:CDS:1 [Cetraspora pellucida]
MDSVNQVQDFVSHLQTPVVLQRISNMNNLNKNLINQILQRANKRKVFTAYHLLKSKVYEEGLLINITDGFIIGKSTQILWGSFTPAEKSTFTTYASQIRSRITI